MTAPNTRSPTRRWALRMLAIVALAAVLIAVRSGMERPSLRNDAQVPQRVALVDPPPARPPPAPEEPQALPEVQDLPDEGFLEDTASGAATGAADDGPPALDGNLGLEGDAEAGFDAFGLRAKRGGRDIMLDVRSGGGGRYSADAVTAFASRLATELEADLRAVPGLRTADYEVRMRVWVDGAGRISKCEVLDTTGQPQIDSSLQHVMNRTTACAGPPPTDFPNPIVLLVRSRGAGATRP
jgi:hypothetical protein